MQAKPKLIFVDKEPLTPQELASVLSSTDNLPWFRAVTQVIRQNKVANMDATRSALQANNPLALASINGAVEFADMLLEDLFALCSPKPE